MNTIVVVGATGNLGRLIVEALLKHQVPVRAVVRHDHQGDSALRLQRLGATTIKINFANPSELGDVCKGASCIVSALQGLKDVIVDIQSNILSAAVKAGVTRFIPSDYSIDFTKLQRGSNRNLDWRSSFHNVLEQSGIAWTSILNGAFSELLPSRMPLIDFEKKSVSYWENADQKMDFTTMDNVAAFTALAAIERFTPKLLRIAGDQISARSLAESVSDLTQSDFKLINLGSLEDLSAQIQRQRAANPESEKQSYPPWQGAQYLHNMFSGLAKLSPLNNDRYPNLSWTNTRQVIATSQGLSAQTR